VKLALTIGTVAGLPNDLATGRPALEVCAGRAEKLATWLNTRPGTV
jgi:hypothetical protein